MMFALPLLIALGVLPASNAEAPALDAANPAGYCERFVSPQDMVECQNTISSLDLDWYAASICAQMDDDAAFIKCIRSISGRLGAPKSLSACGVSDLSDELRAACVQKAMTGVVSGKGARVPSSAVKATPGAYQDLRVKSPARKKQ